MCGIFGYIGNKNNAAEIVFEGLKLLEYRGYDSWGVAVKNGKSVDVQKRVGKIGQANVKLNNSNIGIGHTRWATHGGVTIENAHPHLDCRKQIAVIHNGIVENYEKLKMELIKKEHKFLSETDTEVIAHLIEEYLKKQGFASSVRDAFNELKGLNAIVVMNSKSREIVAAKTGSPLVLGKNGDDIFIASDVSGILKHTNNVMFLKDKEMVILGNGIKLLSLPDGKQLKPQFETVNWKYEDAMKGEYDHFMLKEIYEQPKVIRNIAKEYDNQIITLVKFINTAQGTFFIGAGTAFNACLGGTYIFSKIAREHVNTTVASEFNYLEDFLNKDSLIIALSQSGETIDVIEPLNRAKKKGSKIIAITNVLGSTIYRMSDYKLLLGAGPEKAVASTKAYVAKLSILLLIAFAKAGKFNDGKKLILEAAEEIERILNKENIELIKRIAKVIDSSENLYIIGRGLSYASSLEAALKIKEVSYLHAEGLAGGELKHGPIALISKGTPCIVFAPFDETYDAIISNSMEIKSRGGLIIGISPENNDVFDYWIKVKDTKEATIISEIVPAQLLGYFIAINKGHDPDRPRNLAKSVTVK
ncbi:MAG: glutamine--fructose-6-phosphate transaminase (isomerizing) [Candidatus Levybacteria bacterium]|nr:glutamine--fructose-6-phosphate transaminase (isomerizing) [Candidatus Levybacteria bacterium]